MTSKQLKYGLGNTASGNMNKKALQNKYKQIDLDDMDVQMLSPQFLQSKTLKKPLKDYIFQFDKKSSYAIKAETDKTQKNGIGNKFNFQEFKSIEDYDAHLNKTQKMDYTYISLGQTGKIKPAYQPVQDDKTMKIEKPSSNFEFKLDDSNTIFSAMLKKSSKPKKSITFAQTPVIASNEVSKQPQRKVGKAENKLKQLFNKNTSSTKPSKFSGIEQNGKSHQKKQVHISQDIEQEIQQSINEYGEEQFEKYSQESGAIKESIREQLGGSSGYIKQSIRQSFGHSSGGKPIKSQIMEEIQQSIKGSYSASKDQIPQSIIAGSYKSSGAGIKEQIQQSLSGSRKSGQEVYEQIFEEYQDQFSKSRGTFKKSNNFKDSNDFSKSFRKKTNVVKSIKLAQQINFQAQADVSLELKKKIEQGDKYAQQLLAEKKNFLKKKADIADLFAKKLPYTVPQKNKNLLYEFKIQLNKLLTSQNFQSKLRKLTSFINISPSTQSKDIKAHINTLQDKILQNILTQIDKIKKPQFSQTQIQKMKEQYDEKLHRMLKDQQITLRVEMDKKLHEKDMELKKMIAELEQKFEGKAMGSIAGAKLNNFMAQSNDFINGQGYEMDSDYSIDSDNISWKADLWEALPDYEKRKLYEKQTKQVTNFLTDVMMNELKDQSLNRSLDISFDFPGDQSISHDRQNNLPTLGNNRRNVIEQDSFVMKTSFNRKQLQQNLSMSSSTKKQSVFPDFPRPKVNQSEPFPPLVKKQNINQYSKVQGQSCIQPTKKDLFIKEQVIQILSKYKSSYLRKKNDIIRKILKTMKPKGSNKVSPQQNLLSIVQEMSSILPKQDILPEQIIYVRSYQQQLIWGLINILTKNENKKTQYIEEQMRKVYDRLIVVCQVKVAQNCEQKVTLGLYQEDKKYSNLKGNINQMTIKPCPIQISFNQEAVEMLQKKQEKKVKDHLMGQIMNILMAQFAQEFPKRKK